MTNKLVDFIKHKGIVWKPALAAALSWELAEWAGSKHPYLAPLTVILAIQATVDKSIQFAWQRVLGTVAGVLFTVLLAPYIGLNGWSIGLLLLIGALVVSWLKLEHAMMVQVALSILLVIYFQAKMPAYPFDRIRDTLIGAVVALAIQLLIFPPDTVAKARKKMARFADHLSQHFATAALWVREGCPSAQAHALQTKLQALFLELHQATTELEKAEQSLRYNPLGAKKRTVLHQLKQQMQQLRSGYANLADMIRVCTKWAGTGLLARDNQRLWADHFHALGELVKQWDKERDHPEGPRPVIKDFALEIKAPAHMENQYPLALYMNAEQVIQDFQSSSSRP
ncbi:aromatic acid exporter family protein [Paenibacillus sp. J31TS4]|uniref:FUSC family protein n=1 Tax=Paenibacillus sp. J31TS4 TaxID=2807195 RepID=UPI001BCFE9EB|nr:aromatic acid exporter family protein [Paenibacillus sp. J31TS4]